MSYAEYLRELLRPLGVYDLSAPFNGGELDAQGWALDGAMDWLEEVREELGLTGIGTVHARAEEYAVKHRESFDVAASRAVAALPVLAELCLPLIKVGGVFLAMKSVDSEAELTRASGAIAKLGGTVERTVDYAIPGTDVRHRVIVIRKTGKTPEKYPRAFAKIKKSPLS